MPDVAVLPDSRMRWDLPGIALPPAGTRDTALRWCADWAREVGWRLVDDAEAADALVVGRDVTVGQGRPVVVVEPGQGIDGLRWAIRSLAHRARWPWQTVAYGDHAEQVADVRRPSADPADAGVALLLHGGFWYRAWRRDLMDGVAVDLGSRGWVTWNAEYRRIGAGGGWPATGDDVVAALDHVTRDADAPVSLIGHSAGAQLALWAAAQRPDAVVQVVALAPLCDLAAARDAGLGGGATQRLLGDAPVEDASPITQLPLDVPVLLVHGIADQVVPVTQSRDYFTAARASGDTPELVELDSADHLSVIDPDHHWHHVAERLHRTPL